MNIQKELNSRNIEFNSRDVAIRNKKNFTAIQQTKNIDYWWGYIKNNSDRKIGQVDKNNK